jgi:hypothetical protein
MAVSGALARATEQTAEQELPGMRPTRWSVNLFKPARVRPTTVVTSVIRKGRRIGLIDAELQQDGQSVARSRALFALASRTPSGEVWQPNHSLLAPPLELQPEVSEMRLYFSQHVGWTTRPEPHRNNSPKLIWHFAVVLVEGEQPTPFQLAASVADITSLVVNWGTRGLEFINADIDLVLTRLPTSMQVGLFATDRYQNDGISAGTVVMFDRDGSFGSATTVALANPVVRIDPGRPIDLTAFEN